MQSFLQQHTLVRGVTLQLTGSTVLDGRKFVDDAGAGLPEQLVPPVTYIQGKINLKSHPYTLDTLTLWRSGKQVLHSRPSLLSGSCSARPHY